MKRSEMLEKIEETLQPCNSTYEISRVRTAGRLLDVMEEAGMLPPKTLGIDIKNSKVAGYKIMFEWEEE